MRSRYTQAIVFIAVILAACNSIAQSPLGGLLNSIKNTSGYTIYQGQVVISDSTDVSLVPPFWTKDASVTTTVAAYACSTITAGNDWIWVNTADAKMNPDSFAVEFWMKPASITGVQYVFNSDNRLNIGRNGANLQARMYYGGFQTLTSASVTCSIGVWSHIVLNFRNNAQMVLYKNGVATDSMNCTAPPTWYSTTAYWGYAQYDSYYWDGCYDELVFWNKPLRLDTIVAHYNSGTGVKLTQLPTMIIAYHLDEGTGTAPADYGPNNYVGYFPAGWWVVGKVAGSSSTGGGSLLYSIGTVYNDSILNNGYGFITSVGRGYVAVKNGKTVSVKPGDRVLVTCDSIGLAD
jgi:hypothetical protein